MFCKFESHLVTMFSWLKIKWCIWQQKWFFSCSSLPQVPSPTLDFVRQKGVEVKVLQTERAVAEYNKLASQGAKVGGVFHSTCWCHHHWVTRSDMNKWSCLCTVARYRTKLCLDKDIWSLEFFALHNSSQSRNWQALKSWLSSRGAFDLTLQS